MKQIPPVSALVRCKGMYVCFLFEVVVTEEMFSDTTSLVPGGLNSRCIEHSPIFKAIESFPLWKFGGLSGG